MTMHVCIKYMSSASPSYLLFGLLCTIFVVKANHVQDGADKSCVRREISVSMATSGPF